MFDLFKTSAYLSALITTVVISLWYLVAKPAVLLVFSYRGVIGLTCLVTTRIPKWLLLNRPYRQQSLSSQTQEGAYWERWSWHTGLHLFSVLQLEVVTDNVFFFLVQTIWEVCVSVGCVSIHCTMKFSEYLHWLCDVWLLAAINAYLWEGLRVEEGLLFNWWVVTVDGGVYLK